MWLTPHLRDPQPEGERDCLLRSEIFNRECKTLSLHCDTLTPSRQ